MYTTLKHFSPDRYTFAGKFSCVFSMSVLIYMLTFSMQKKGVKRNILCASLRRAVQGIQDLLHALRKPVNEVVPEVGLFGKL